MDSFERTSPSSISFKGALPQVDLHLPSKKIRELLSQSYGLIQLESSVSKKDLIRQNYDARIHNLISNVDQDSYKCGKGSVYYDFSADRIHEISNPMTEFNLAVTQHKFKINDREMSCQKYDEKLKYRNSRIMSIIRRYESFINNGFDNGSLKVKDILDYALNSASLKAKRKNIKIVTEGEDVLQEFSEGVNGANGKIHDYTFYAIFSNLIQNSAKYARKNSEILVKFEKQQINDEKYLVFSVRDEGIGIPKDQHGAVLDGKRASNAIESGIEGSGYGLKRVGKILEMLKSKMIIKSPINEGNKDFPGTEISCLIKLKDEPKVENSVIT